MTVEQLRALIDATTPGPWEAAGSIVTAMNGQRWVAETNSQNLGFICAFDPVLCARLLDVAETARVWSFSSRSDEPFDDEDAEEICSAVDRAVSNLDALLAAVVLPEGKPE